MKEELERELRELIRLSKAKEIHVRRERAALRQGKSDREIYEESVPHHGFDRPVFTEEELGAFVVAQPEMFLTDPEAAESEYLDQSVQRLLPKVEELRAASGKQGPLTADEVMTAESAWAEDAKATLIGFFGQGEEFVGLQGDDEMVQLLKQAQENLVLGATTEDSMSLADRMLKHVFGKDRPVE